MSPANATLLKRRSPATAAAKSATSHVNVPILVLAEVEAEEV